jgi:glycosyltransferase involved in cell wall biosynthesis
MSRRPRFSILLPLYESDPRWLRRALLSVRRQFYPEWELCVADDASTKSAGWKIVERYARADGRIKCCGARLEAASRRHPTMRFLSDRSGPARHRISVRIRRLAGL